jgi:hypothetical protein
MPLYFEQGDIVYAPAVPRERRYRGKRDVLGLETLDDLALSLQFGSRATVVQTGAPEQARLAAYNVESVLLKADQSMAEISSAELKVSPIYYFEDHRLPTVIEDIVQDRVSRLTQIACEAYEVSADAIECKIEILTRQTGFTYHRDPEDLVYVENLLGPGTCLSGGLGEVFYPLTRWNYTQVQEGQGIMFNLEGQALHAGPELSDTLPRLGMAFFLDRKL